MNNKGPVWLERLDSISLTPGEGKQVELYDIAKRRNDKFTALLGLAFMDAMVIDQAASGGTAIGATKLYKALSSIALESKLKVIGSLFPSSLNGAHLFQIAYRLLGFGPLMGWLQGVANVPNTDGTVTRIVPHIMPFADARYVDPTDFALPPAALAQDVVRLAAAAANILDDDSTGAVVVSHAITPYAIMGVRDDAVVPVIRQWRKHDRSTARHKFGVGLFTDVIALSDVLGLGAANGFDTLTSCAIEREGQYTYADPTILKSLENAAVGDLLGGAAATGSYAAADVPSIGLYGPSGPLGHNQLTKTVISPDPLTVEFTETSVGGGSKAITGELLPQTEDRVKEFAREVYGIASPSLKPKRLRPGTGDAQLAPAKRLVLPYTVR